MLHNNKYIHHLYCTEEYKCVSQMQIKWYLWIELWATIEDNFSILWAIRLFTFHWKKVKNLYFLFGPGFVLISQWGSNRFSEKKK